MNEFIKRIPIPAAGVALGLAALGNLLASLSGVLQGLCGVLSAILAMLVIAKAIMFPAMIREDFRNPILASVSATLFMTLMQLAGYVAPLSYGVGLALWFAAIAGHLTLMVWFAVRYVAKFSLAQVFPTWFITYVGIIVAAVTSPIFAMEALGTALFWFGFACYPVLLAAITVRYAKHAVPEPARPLFCIYTAPASLSLVGYLAVTPEPNMVFATLLLIAAQGFLILVLSRLPKFLALPFYPSYAAMTFPFVITATALVRMVELHAAQGAAIPLALNALVVVEVALAAAMVAYVVLRYALFLTEPWRTAAPALEEEEAEPSMLDAA